MTEFNNEFGVHFTTHIANHYRTPELATYGRLASELGFDQVWVNENLGYRDMIVVLSAIASRTSIKLGTGIAIPYLRNPIDFGTAIATLSELSDATPISVGLGRGSSHLFQSRFDAPEPYRMIRETAAVIDRLLDGQMITLDDYSLTADYFNFKPGVELELAFSRDTSVELLVGGFGETAMTLAGEHLDGTIIVGIPSLDFQRVRSLISIADKAAVDSDARPPKHVIELPVSVATTRDEAYEFARPFVAHMITGSTRQLLSDAEFRDYGIDPSNLDQLEESLQRGVPINEASELVSDSMVELLFVVGRPDKIRARLLDKVDTLNRMDIGQILFQHLGPDYEIGLKFLSDELGLVN